jgi:UDP-N-acetylglucosamine pyrophosphorylase
VKRQIFRFMTENFRLFEEKMRAAGQRPIAIKAFRHNYKRLVSGESGMIPEESIEPARDLPRLEDSPEASPKAAALLPRTVVIKLNGGLGTSMGLERAKSLLPVRDGLTFLDFIARQVLHLRETYSAQLRFMLMNSFSTSEDTLQFLKKYPAFGNARDLELLQSQAPKIDAKSFTPAVCSDNPALEWCPPGHGDIYPCLLDSGTLDDLLKAGVIYAFVSNSDNLGATLDIRLLQWFAKSGSPFMMEVAERTASDRKGGHLASSHGRFLLRESAQCPEPDMEAFQDITRHAFFNTNNLWLRLDRLKDLLTKSDGIISLPLIRNAKNVDPRNKNSPPVIQLETAMGAAIGCFEDAAAIIVPRTRFAPVKTTSDLLTIRSDAYAVTRDWRLVLDREGNPQPPRVDLDPSFYKVVDQLDASLQAGIPSMKRCHKLTLSGPIGLGSGNVFEGEVTITNRTKKTKPLPPGVYCDCAVDLG